MTRGGGQAAVRVRRGGQGAAVRARPLSEHPEVVGRARGLEMDLAFEAPRPPSRDAGNGEYAPPAQDDYKDSGDRGKRGRDRRGGRRKDDDFPDW